MKRIREYFEGKTRKQRILIFIGIALIIAFIFFIVKGAAGSGIRFRVNPVDVIILAGLIVAYVFFKRRGKKQ